MVAGGVPRRLRGHEPPRGSVRSVSRTEELSRDSSHESSTFPRASKSLEARTSEVKPGLGNESLRFRSEASNLRNEVLDLGSEVSGLRNEVSGLRSEASGLRSEASGLGSEVSGLRSEAAGLGSEVPGLGSEPQASKWEGSGLEVKASELGHELRH